MKTILTLIIAVAFAVSASAHCGTCGTDKPAAHKCGEACKPDCKGKDAKKCAEGCSKDCCKKGEAKK
jgi:hypothetical protein